jgi:hypothetical protein
MQGDWEWRARMPSISAMFGFTFWARVSLLCYIVQWENIATEHFAMTTQIDFDNQLPRCFARVPLIGETSIVR